MDSSFVEPVLLAMPLISKRISPGPPTTGDESATARAPTVNVIDRPPLVKTNVAPLAPLELMPYRSTSSEVYGTVIETVTTRPCV